MKLMKIIALIAAVSAPGFAQQMEVHTKGSAAPQTYKLADIEKITFVLATDTATSPKSFRITNQLSGWTEPAQQGYVEYVAEGLYDLINGGAPEYIQTGLVDGIYQELNRTSDNARIQAYVMNFGTTDSATAMFNRKKGQIESVVTIGAYANSVAAGEKFLGTTLRTLAHFGKYYFEITVFGTESISESISVIESVLKFCESVAE
jgi:hypothetical protein